MSDYPCPECDAAPATFGALLSHLRADHGVRPQDAFDEYGGDP